MALNREWGIHSHATGRTYLWANTQDDAERMQAATGKPEQHDVVRLVSGRVQKYETRSPAPAIPEFATRPMVAEIGDDAEVIRMILVLTDPFYGVQLPPLPLTAAQIRERADQKACAIWKTSVRRWYWARQRRSGAPGYPR